MSVQNRLTEVLGARGEARHRRDVVALREVVAAQVELETVAREEFPPARAVVRWIGGTCGIEEHRRERRGAGDEEEDQ